MSTVRNAVASATTEAQVLGRLSTFLEYLKNCHVDSVLPRRFSGLSASTSGAVREWSRKLQEPGHYDYRLSAAGQCWIEEVREAFMAAARRLDEIEAGAPEPDLARDGANEGGKGHRPHADSRS